MAGAGPSGAVTVGIAGARAGVAVAAAPTPTTLLLDPPGPLVEVGHTLPVPSVADESGPAELSSPVVTPARSRPPRTRRALAVGAIAAVGLAIAAVVVGAGRGGPREAARRPLWARARRAGSRGAGGCGAAAAAPAPAPIVLLPAVSPETARTRAAAVAPTAPARAPARAVKRGKAGASRASSFVEPVNDDLPGAWPRSSSPPRSGWALRGSEVARPRRASRPSRRRARDLGRRRSAPRRRRSCAREMRCQAGPGGGGVAEVHGRVPSGSEPQAPLPPGAGGERDRWPRGRRAMTSWACLDAAKNASVELRAAAEAKRQQLRAKVGLVTVRRTPADAELFIHGVKAGGGAGRLVSGGPGERAIVLGVGAHRLSLERGPVVHGSQTVTIAGGDTLDVRLGAAVASSPGSSAPSASSATPSLSASSETPATTSAPPALTLTTTPTAAAEAGGWSWQRKLAVGLGGLAVASLTFAIVESLVRESRAPPRSATRAAARTISRAGTAARPATTTSAPPSACSPPATSARRCSAARPPRCSGCRPRHRRERPRPPDGR